MYNDGIGSIFCTYVYDRRRILSLIISGIPFLLTGFLILIIVCAFLFIKKYPLNKTVIFGISGIYFLILMVCIWFPIKVIPGYRVLESPFIQLMPLYTIVNDISLGDINRIGRDICANILMTVPYGMMVPFLFKFKKRWQYVLHMFAFPMAIELSQLLICLALDSHYRTADIDDVILNALGIFIGYILYRYLPKRIKDFLKGDVFSGRICTSNERTDKKVWKKDSGKQSESEYQKG